MTSRRRHTTRCRSVHGRCCRSAVDGSEADRAPRTIYRGGAGQWAFIAHRTSGFLVFFFLLLHVVDVSLVNVDPALYNQISQLYGNVVLRLFEASLLFALLFHALNGLRIVLIDFFPWVAPRQRQLLLGVVGLTLAAGVPGGIVILWPFVEGSLLT